MKNNIQKNAETIIELCTKISNKLSSYGSDGDTYREYYIPIINDFVIFCISLDCYEYIQTVKYKNFLFDITISKYNNDCTINYKLGNNEFNMDDEIINNIFNETIDKLNQFYIEHEGKLPPKETITILENICNQNIRILLHGTDYSNIDSILSQGLKIWNVGLSCRTTVMVDNNVEKILSYKYSDFPRPRNIIIAIPKYSFEKKDINLQNKYTMDKCRNCTAQISSGYDNWCYADNYIYEMIACETNNGWVIPPEFIFGYIDYNGNITLNKNYLQNDNKLANDELLKTKKLKL